MFALIAGCILDPFWLHSSPKIGPKMDAGHPWGIWSPKKRTRAPEDPQEASKMEPKLSPGPSKSNLWATISLTEMVQKWIQATHGAHGTNRSMPRSPRSPKRQPAWSPNSTQCTCSLTLAWNYTHMLVFVFQALPSLFGKPNGRFLFMRCPSNDVNTPASCIHFSSDY